MIATAREALKFQAQTAKAYLQTRQHHAAPDHGTPAAILLITRHITDVLSVCVQEGGGASRILQKVELPIVSADRCRRLYGDLPQHQICAGYPEIGGKDSCQVRHRLDSTR
jgi:hypothetical protein